MYADSETVREERLVRGVPAAPTPPQYIHNAPGRPRLLQQQPPQLPPQQLLQLPPPSPPPPQLQMPATFST